jgi:hypothetical protein
MFLLDFIHASGRENAAPEKAFHEPSFVKRAAPPTARLTDQEANIC